MDKNKSVRKRRTMRFGDKDFQTTLLNKALEKHGVDCDYVIANHEINGVPWYQYYTNTTQEDLDWREWCYKYAKDNVVGQSKLKKDVFEKFMALFYLAYSLKIQD